MPDRRILIVGTQWNKAPNHLHFLPEVAQRLHKLMTEGPGECTGVWLGVRPPGLLLDPTVAEAKAAIKAAIAAAAEAGDALILVYVGHGEFPDERSGDFYLMPTDATEPTHDGAIHLADFIRDRIRDAPGLLRLLVLVDACFAAPGEWQAMERWAQAARGSLEFEFLTATDDRKTAGAPLAHTLIEILKRGDPERGDQITCGDVHDLLKRQHHPAQCATYNAGGLGLGRNIAKDPGEVFWKDCASRPLILKQTEYFQPTPQLARLVEASKSHPVVILTGESGAGKSTMAAALARPELTDGLVPEGFVHAVAMIDPTTDQQSLAEDLARQLSRSLPAFKEAVGEFQRRMGLEGLKRFGFLAKMVLEPLKHLVDDAEVRVVLAGFNLLQDDRRKTVGRELEARPDCLRLIITAHPDTPNLPNGKNMNLEKSDDETLEDYLGNRRVPKPARAAILDKSRGSWLITKLLADAVLANPKLGMDQLPGTVAEAYKLRLKQAGAADAWNERFHPILAVLAVSGSGPVLPLPLLIRASAQLGGPSDEEAVQSVLNLLRGLTVRAEAGTPNERVGLSHQTLAEYLLGPAATGAGYAADGVAAHRAMVAAIDELAPSANHQQDDPLHRYAFRREAHHLWAIGEVERTLICLSKRRSNMPRENLERWNEWSSWPSDGLCNGAPTTLWLRSYIAHWTGEAGDATGALTLFVDLLPDMMRTLGPDHPETLKVRGNIAGWTGEAGDATEALTLFNKLLPDTERALGPDDLETLRVRGNIATWTGRAGDARKALALHNELLPDMTRVFGPDYPETLLTRHIIAALTIETGDARGAIKLIEDLRPDMERVFGADHPATLQARSNIAHGIGENGDPREALALYKELLPDMERTLGADHPATLTARNNIAYWTGKVVGAHEALKLFMKLVPDMAQVLGADHPNTLKARGDIALLTNEIGDTRGALNVCTELLPDMTRRLGADHRDTLTLLGMVGALMIQTGDRSEGCQRLREALDRAEKRYGLDHALTMQFKDLSIRHVCN